MGPIPKATEEKIAQLQLFEQNLQSLSAQKQSLQSQILEMNNAVKEVEIATGVVYKIVGPIMIHAEKEKITKDLKERKDVLDLRIKSVEKQEKSVEEKAKELQTEIMAELETLEKNGRTH